MNYWLLQVHFCTMPCFEWTRTNLQASPSKGWERKPSKPNHSCEQASFHKYVTSISTSTWVPEQSTDLNSDTCTEITVVELLRNVKCFSLITTWMNKAKQCTQTNNGQMLLYMLAPCIVDMQSHVNIKTYTQAKMIFSVTHAWWKLRVSCWSNDQGTF